MDIYDVLGEVLSAGGRNEDHALHRFAVLAKAREAKALGDPAATHIDEAAPGRQPGQVTLNNAGPVIDLDELAKRLLSFIAPPAAPAPAPESLPVTPPSTVTVPAPEPAGAGPAPDLAAQLAKALGQV